jgi:hypothetical protein
MVTGRASACEEDAKAGGLQSTGLGDTTRMLHRHLLSAVEHGRSAPLSPRYRFVSANRQRGMADSPISRGKSQISNLKSDVFSPRALPNC